MSKTGTKTISVEEFVDKFSKEFSKNRENFRNETKELFNVPQKRLNIRIS